MTVQQTTCPWSRSAEEVLDELDVNLESGLDSGSLQQRRRQFGTNSIDQKEGPGPLRILVNQFRSIVVLILCVAAALALAIGKTTEAVAIVAVVLVNCGIGFFSEWQASKSMQALRRMGRRKVRTRRDGNELEVDAVSLVCGDICLHEGGDMASADLRLIEANNLQVDESDLTGESEPVGKTTQPLPEQTVLAERSNMFYRGTTITNGSALGVVVAVGSDTELGRIAELAEGEDKVRRAPLERRLDQLGHRLAWVALGACVAVGAVGLLVGKSVVLMVETSVALGVAAIPEGLPIVATIGLARGMWLMARKQALVKRLPAVETLGATNMVMTDKTGTLTENSMRVAQVVTATGEHELPPGDGETSGRQSPEWPISDSLAERALEIGVLCNNAAIGDEDADDGDPAQHGDPTEVALLEAGIQIGIHRQSLLEKKPEEREIAFDSGTMMMATVHAIADHSFEVAVKGAPAAVLDACTGICIDDADRCEDLDDKRRDEWKERAQRLAEQGLRTLAMAFKQVDSLDEAPYQDLNFVAVLGMLDPPREDVRDVLAACRKAGIRVVMVTGDQPETARAIAARLALVEDNDAAVLTGRDLQDLDDPDEKLRQTIIETEIFARVSPKQKLNLLQVFQGAGNTVAMTGDGVNDAPALSKADIGVVMGRRGTDAAKESGDIILKDDSFSTIVSAIEQGRVIFINIRRAAVFMLCTNLAEILAVGIASAINAPLPLRPLQILFLNVITDVFPAMALAVGKGEPEQLMSAPPRPRQETILRRAEWMAIGAWSVAISLCVLLAPGIGRHVLNLSQTQAVTLSFLTLGFAKLWFVFNLRSSRSTLLHNDILQNPAMWGALALCAILLITAVYLPLLSGILATAAPGANGWLTVLLLSLMPTIIGQLHLAMRRN